MDKIEYQIETIHKMVVIYCKKKHNKTGLCSDCEELYLYAKHRLELCPFGIDKPECKDCQIHCYNAQKRQKMKEVMRFSGPRMLLYHPLDFLKHLKSKK